MVVLAEHLQSKASPPSIRCLVSLEQDWGKKDLGVSDVVLGVWVWVVLQAVTWQRKLVSNRAVSAMLSLKAYLRLHFGMTFLVLLPHEKYGFSTELFLRLCLVLTAVDTNTF